MATEAVLRPPLESLRRTEHARLAIGTVDALPAESLRL